MTTLNLKVDDEGQPWGKMVTHLLIILFTWSPHIPLVVGGTHFRPTQPHILSSSFLPTFPSTIWDASSSYVNKFMEARYEVSNEKKYRRLTCKERLQSGDVELRNLSGSVSTYNIVALLPFDSNRKGFSSIFSIEKVFPAIDIALEKIKSFQLLPDGHELVFRYAEDLPGDHAEALNTAIQMVFNNKADMFLGPAFDYAAGPIARQARYWNMPLFTAGAFASEIGQHKKDLYNMVIRVGATLDVLCQCILRTLVENKWKRVKLVRQPDGLSRITARFCQLAINGLHDLIKRSSHNISHDFTKFDDVRNFLDVINEQIGMKFSIIVLCADPEAVREVILRAYELGYCNGEYVFINIDLFASEKDLARPWLRDSASPEENQRAMKAYDSVLTVTLKRPSGVEFEQFSREVKERAKLQAIKPAYEEDEEVNNYVGAFHDAVMLYALALNETISEGLDPYNGTIITRKLWNRTFHGITGQVSIDENGDREMDYSLLDLNPDQPEEPKFEIVANYFGHSRRYVQLKPIHWAGGALDTPKDVPVCGFDGSGCPMDAPFPAYGYVIAVLGSLLFTVLIIFLVGYKKYVYDQRKYDEKYWRISSEDVEEVMSELPLRDRNIYNGYAKDNRRSSLTSRVSYASIFAGQQKFTRTAIYKTRIVVVKKLKPPIIFKQAVLKDIKKMRDLQNDHIVQFIGICTDPNRECILTEYCQKGSLDDVLEDEELHMDRMFKLSLIQDLVKGVHYIHSSEVHYHGNLKTSNCVVDSRFVLKLTDFGIESLKRGDNIDSNDPNIAYKRLLWTAPEFLRNQNSEELRTHTARQKGDVYSFAIICQEILLRNGSFWVEREDPEMMPLTPKEIIERVKMQGCPVPLRPTLSDSNDCPISLASLIRGSWSEDARQRPDFRSIKNSIRTINRDAGCSGNLVDNLLIRLENYARNLEEQVKDRTADYLEEKKRAEDLLYRMLPQSVAQILMKGEKVEAEKFESVTIYFSDICGFTKLSSNSTPIQVVHLLNDLYTTFDAIIDTWDVYKVETIGDAYMVVSGLPVRNGNTHAREISRMALQLLNAVRSFKIRHRPNEKLLLRIGIHSGPVCAGVVGKKMPRYCLFGDTVNTASRMESNGEALKIHVSPETKGILDSFKTFVLTTNKVIEPKGKAPMLTWWLWGENNPEFPDLSPPESILVHINASDNFIPEQRNF